VHTGAALCCGLQLLFKRLRRSAGWSSGVMCYADVIIAGLADVKATQAVGGASAYTVEMHLPLHIYR